MAEFKNKEEYQKWKAEKSKKISAPAVNSSDTSKIGNKIPAALPKPNKLQKILFLIFSIIAFLSLFDNFGYVADKVISVWSGYGLLKGLSFSIGISVLIVLILTIASLYTDRIKHFKATVSILSIVTILILLFLITYQTNQSKKEFASMLSEFETQEEYYSKASLELSRTQDDYWERFKEYLERERIAREGKDFAEQTIKEGIHFKIGVSGILLLTSQVGLLITTIIKKK